ncbi:MAG: hypothetical protein CR988_04000 [Treponema sp.]|nr:MAG: hypothetical protein CR988_04000 [Treponema sp.]
MQIINALNETFADLFKKIFNTQWASIIIIIAVLLIFILGKIIGSILQKNKFRHLIGSERKDAIKRSRAVLTGQFTEQLAPYLPDFPADPTEVRFIGKPIDYIAFSGSSKGCISEVLFIEVKSGAATLSPVEKELKKAVLEKKVRYVEYHFSHEK